MKITTLRWSAISSWDYSKEQWFDTYGRPLLGLPAIEQKSPQLSFGTYVDDKLQEDDSFIPSHPRYPIRQHVMKVMYGGIELTGKLDWADFDKHQLWDTKTGVQPWTKKRADEHGQLTMYLMMLYIANKKIKPEEWELGIHWIPTKKTETGDFKTIIDFRDNPIVPFSFPTKRTMLDILKFGGKIKNTAALMEKYLDAKLPSLPR